MGLFTSVCPDCLREIDWFIHVPQDYVCACGRAVTPDEIEYSWNQQVGNNPQTWDWLMSMTVEQLEGMLAEYRQNRQAGECRAVRSPIEGDDRCLIPGHISLLESVLKEKRGDVPAIK